MNGINNALFLIFQKIFAAHQNVKHHATILPYMQTNVNQSKSETNRNAEFHRHNHNRQCGTHGRHNWQHGLNAGTKHIRKGKK